MSSKKLPNPYAVLGGGGGDEIFSNDCHTEWLRVSLSEMPEYFKKGEKKKAAIRLGKTLEVYD